MQKTKDTVRGRDLDRPMRRMTFAGESCQLVFDNNAFRIAEDVYETQYGRDCGFAQIIRQLTMGKLGAIMAVMYGGLVSGGRQVEWDIFARDFRLTDVEGVQELLMAGVKDALPEGEAADATP